MKQLAYKVGSEAALDEIAEIAEEQRLPYRWETEQDRPRLLRLQDPFGFPVAFYFQSVKHPWLLQRFDLHRGPGIQRIDHVNVLSPQVKSLTDWYRQNLDFRLTEYSEDDEGRIWASWMQRKGHAHDLATTNGNGPRLHHFAYWMPDGSRISQTCDILAGRLRDRPDRARPRAARHHQCVLSLPARPGRPPHRTFHFGLSERSTRTSSRSAGISTIRGGSNCGAARRRRAGSWKAVWWRPSTAGG